MTANVPSWGRRGLPEAYSPCGGPCCRKVIPAKRDVHGAQFRLNPNKKRDNRLTISDSVLNNGSKFPRDRRVVGRRSILDLPDENVEQVFNFVQDPACSLCLALTCKRLLRIYSTQRYKREENRRWNGKDGGGFWKQRLMPLLARGWVNRAKFRLCFGCWRFCRYGKASTEFWEGLLLSGQSSCQRYPWRENWEIRMWLGQEDVVVEGSGVHDHRIRCPLCVLRDHKIRLPMPNREVHRRRTRTGVTTTKATLDAVLRTTRLERTFLSEWWAVLLKLPMLDFETTRHIGTELNFAVVPATDTTTINKSTGVARWLADPDLLTKLNASREAMANLNMILLYQYGL